MSEIFLVASSDAATLDVIQKTLQGKEVSVVAAQDGLQALDLALDRSPDAIFLSLDLARVDGIELARALRALEPTERVPIIFLAANEAEANQIVKEGLPFTETLIAPFTPDQVQAQSEYALRHAKGIADISHREIEGSLRSIDDPLTHVYQRRYVIHRLAYESARSARYTNPLSVLLVDVDNLKEINSAHGTLIGDAVLIETAGIIYSNLRRADLIGRYDKQDFILVLPETNEEGALTLANRICRVVQTHKFMDGKINLRVTVSVGVAGGSGADMAENLALIARAATALDKGKLEGKNRVEIG